MYMIDCIFQSSKREINKKQWKTMGRPPNVQMFRYRRQNTGQKSANKTLEQRKSAGCQSAYRKCNQIKSKLSKI